MGQSGWLPAFALWATAEACQSGAPPSGLQAVDSVVRANYPDNAGVELAIFKEGQLLFERGYGLRDRGLPDAFAPEDAFWDVAEPDQTHALARGPFAPDANTLFNLASVSKEFTAGAILLLQQDGLLSTGDPISKYFAGLPGGDAITLLFLLQHRSGFVDYNQFGGTIDFSAAYHSFLANGDRSATLRQLATYPLDFAPGSQFEYSNTNYLLLALVVEQVSGEAFGEFLRRRIFAPLAMSLTNQGYPQPPVQDVALGYRQALRDHQWNLAWLAGPGGLTSTVGDLEKWNRAVRAPGLFTGSSLAQMFAPSPIDTSVGPYAAGWFIASLDGHTYVWHDGALGGFQTMNATFPNDGIDIIILTNAGVGLDPYFIIPQLFEAARSQ
jgi:CubicO group peptidase (beta-lactamase class C family)